MCYEISRNPFHGGSCPGQRQSFNVAVPCHAASMRIQTVLAVQLTLRHIYIKLRIR